MTELCKSPEHDPRASEIKENELNSNNCGEIENKSIASATHLNNQSMEIINQNQITYAEAVNPIVSRKISRHKQRITKLSALNYPIVCLVMALLG